MPFLPKGIEMFRFVVMRIISKVCIKSESMYHYALLAFIALVFNFILIVNPGYRNHDELVIMATVAKKPLTELISINIDFGSQFFRPLGYMIASLIMKLWGEYPPFVHILGFLIHVVNAFLVLVLVRRLIGKDYAIYAFLFFAVSPAIVMATGWVVGIYDQLWTLFGLVYLIFIHKSFEAERQRARFLCSSIAMFALVAALLAKETAIIIPGFLLIYGMITGWNKGLLRWCVWSCGTVAVYLLLRANALLAIAMTDNSPYGYSISLGTNVLWNTILYFLYPFSWRVSEVHALLDVMSLREIALAASAHMLLVIFLVRQRIRYGMAYVAAYILPLLPVLLLQKQESQYLYATAIPTAIGFAVIARMKKGTLNVGAVFLLAVMLVAHTLYAQAALYRDGLLQMRALTGLMTVARSLTADSGNQCVLKMQIVPEEGSPWWVIARATHDMKSIGGIPVESIDVVRSDQVIHDSAVLVYTRDGYIVLRREPSLKNSENFNTSLVLKDYGPKNIFSGQDFNMQPSGMSAIWVNAENATPTTVVVLGGERLRSIINADGSLVTAGVPRHLYAKKGEYPLYLLDPITGKKSSEIKFVVK
jgi:hypothetical protein